MDKLKSYFADVLSVLTGCILISFAVTAILKPNNLITGGITGMSIILDSITGISYTYFYYGLAMIILLLNYLLLGKYEARKIILLSFLMPTFIMIFSKMDFNLTENDMFLAAVYYGIIGGLGAGILLKRGFSSGGTDSLGKIIHKKIYPFISISQIITTIDIIIVIVSIYSFNIRVALYAILTQLIFMKSAETVLYGLGSKLMKLEIISEKQSEIEEYILHSIRRGITKYKIIGGYSNQEKTKVVTICSPRESMLIKKFIADVDQNAFIDILPVSSVWGQGIGFSNIKDE